MPRSLARFSPGRTLLVALVFAIGVGTLLLALPASRHVDIPLIDLIFTATSSLSVTGMSTIPLSSFTQFGHVVLLILMQIGGLGLITLTLFLVNLFVDVGLTTQLMVGQMLDLDEWKHIKQLLVFIIVSTLTIELIGACIFYPTFASTYPFHEACFLSFFHAVSSFCNIGVCLFPDGMVTYNHNYTMLLGTSTLLFLGGMGFTTLHQLASSFIAIRRQRFKCSFQHRLIISTTVSILIFALFLFLLLERMNAFQGMSPGLSLVNALFTALSARSAGFLSLPWTDFAGASLLVIMIMAFIGSSPGSTGSGIKVTTFAICLATIKCVISGKADVQIKGRNIYRDQVLKAITIVSLSSAWIMLMLFCLLITEEDWTFLDLLFETVSAFANLGISRGVTPYFSVLGKIFMILTMIIGRLGSLTLILALRQRSDHKKEYSYPQERVMLS